MYYLNSPYLGDFNVKKNIWMILVGVTVMHVAVFSALFVSSGCAKNEVMGERKFVPSAGGEAPMVAPKTGAPQVSPMAPPPVVDAPKADDKVVDKAPVAKKEYESMKYAGSSKPVTSAVGASHSSATAAGGTYEVKSGDTIGKIANAHGVSMAALLKANNLTKESKLKVGQKLVIPGKSAAASAKGDDKVSVKAPAAKSAEAAATVAAKDSGNTYTVKAGDSIPKIAKSLGVKEADLKKVNNLSDAATKQLKIGQKLVIPGKEGAADTAAVTAPVAETSAPAPVVAASTAPAATATAPAATTTAPAAGAAIDAGDPSTPVQLTKDMTIEEFAAEQKTTVDKIRSLNQDLDKSGKLKSGQIVFVP